MGEASWYAMPAEEALRQLASNSEGLSQDEAARRLERFGPNTLREEKRVSPWEIFLGQFKNFLILLLIAATVISLFLGETLDAIVIFAIVIASAILGFYQEYRAERAMQALKAMASPAASVLRGGEEVEIPAAEVVPGDVMLLTAGDRIPADGRLLLAANVRIEEASLTGESTAVGKDAKAVLPDNTTIGDRRNLVFAATVITYGRGRAVVIPSTLYSFSITARPLSPDCSTNTVFRSAMRVTLISLYFESIFRQYCSTIVNICIPFI